MSPSDGWSRSALLVAADAIDVAGLERLVDHVVGGGVHGLFVLGTTGDGPELLLPEACRLGGHGAIPGGANVMPRLFADLYAAVMAGNTARVESLRGRARQLANLYDVGRMPGRIVVGIKTALAAMGICHDAVASPFKGSVPTSGDASQGFLTPWATRCLAQREAGRRNVKGLRRSVMTAADLADHVIPPVAVRQRPFALPFPTTIKEVCVGTLVLPSSSPPAPPPPPPLPPTTR